MQCWHPDRNTQGKRCVAFLERGTICMHCGLRAAACSRPQLQRTPQRPAGRAARCSGQAGARCPGHVAGLDASAAGERLPPEPVGSFPAVVGWSDCGPGSHVRGLAFVEAPFLQRWMHMPGYLLACLLLNIMCTASACCRVPARACCADQHERDRSAGQGSHKEVGVNTAPSLQAAQGT